LPAIAKLRRVLPFLSLAVLAVVLYDAWVFYARRERVREVERQRAEKESAEARRTLELIGGFRILDLYAAPAAIQRGKSARLCYSVVGAKSVRTEPEVEGVYPAFSHCVEISPKQDTVYTLFAEDEAGHSINKNVTVQVLPRAQQGTRK
jgi:hypothetical protein